MQDLALDKLHDFCLNPDWTSFKSGRTTFLTYKLIGEIQLGDSTNIIILVPSIRDTHWLREMISKACLEEGIIVTSRTNNVLKVRYEGVVKELKFVANVGKDTMIGIPSINVLFNFDDYTKNSIINEEEENV